MTALEESTVEALDVRTAAARAWRSAVAAAVLSGRARASG